MRFIFKFFRFTSKQIPYLFSLNSLVLESIKISWKLIFYFSNKILNGIFRSYNSYNINLLTIFQDSLCSIFLVVLFFWSIILVQEARPLFVLPPSQKCLCLLELKVRKISYAYVRAYAKSAPDQDRKKFIDQVRFEGTCGYGF